MTCRLPLSHCRRVPRQGPGRDIEGVPAGLSVDDEYISEEMARRRLGYGRGPRMRFEADELTLLGGIRHGRTLGSPVAIEIRTPALLFRKA